MSETRTWPKPTSRWLISGWSSTGSQDCKFSLFKAISGCGLRIRWQRDAPRLLGCLGWGLVPPEPVGDTVHMHVDADPGVPIAIAHEDKNGLTREPHVQLPRYLQGQERHFRAHPGQRTELVHGLRNVAPELVLELLRGLSDVPGYPTSGDKRRVVSGFGAKGLLRLAPPEADLAYGVRDGALASLKDRLDRQGPANGRAEFRHRGVRDLVLRLGREHEGDERGEALVLLRRSVSTCRPDSPRKYEEEGADDTYLGIALLELRLFAPHGVDGGNDARAHALHGVVRLAPARRRRVRRREGGRDGFRLAGRGRSVLFRTRLRVCGGF